MSDNNTSPFGLRARIARRTTKEWVEISRGKLERSQPGIIIPGLYPPGYEDLTPENLLQPQDPDHSSVSAAPKSVNFNIGIIGGGMTGLYTAMILEDLGVPYEILERSKVCGGRVWTHYFSNPKKNGDYYDVGAMRFPDIPIMRRTFKLFQDLHITKDTTDHPPQNVLIPYYFQGPCNPLYYNNILKIQSEEEDSGDYFGVSVSNGGLVPDRFVEKGYKKIIKDILGDWRESFQQNFEKTWKELMEQDQRCVSMRAYMYEKLARDAKKPGGVYYATNWCETMDAATNHYDCSFVVSLLHSLEFDYPLHPATSYDPCSGGGPGENVWWCINGGAGVITERMLEKIDSNNVQYENCVTAIKADLLTKPGHMTVTVKTPTGTHTKDYSYVISTATMPALQAMDLRDAGLKYSYREAIRVLRYDNSIKVGIKFKSRWWANKKNIKRGGIGKTDRPTRVVVYPSYALDTPPDETGVLLACYNWAQDASTLGGYKEEEIVSLVIADLADMHDMKESEIRGDMIDYHVHNWNEDTNDHSIGPFGMFGPGQFSTLFPELQAPTAKGRFIFAGEITSIYHGWIVAALNSSFRAVLDILIAQYTYSENPAEKLYIRRLIAKLVEKWGGRDFEPREGSEYDTNLRTAVWQVFLGMVGDI